MDLPQADASHPVAENPYPVLGLLLWTPPSDPTVRSQRTRERTLSSLGLPSI